LEKVGYSLAVSLALHGLLDECEVSFDVVMQKWAMECSLEETQVKPRDTLASTISVDDNIVTYILDPITGGIIAFAIFLLFCIWTRSELHEYSRNMRRQWNVNHDAQRQRGLRSAADFGRRPHRIIYQTGGDEEILILMCRAGRRQAGRAYPTVEIV
jgi:hypothetical protein